MNIAITGTARGIGQALAQHLSKDHTVIDINRPQYDLSDFNTLEQIDFSGVDVLILNAGVLDKATINSSFEQHDAEKWRYIINCNVIGNLCLIQQYIKQRDHGTVVFVSGATVTRRKEGSTSIIHTMSKKAISSFVEDIRYELHNLAKPIRFVDVKPGLTKPHKSMIDASKRIPTSYQEVVDGIEFAIKNKSILNIDFEKHEPLLRD